MRCAALASMLLATACGADAEPPPPQVASACPTGHVEMADGCAAPGVPAAMCATGFEPTEEGGCEPLLPAAPCGDGEMALPGENTCRGVADCGEGTWGNIAVDASTQFVDGSYAGMDSDGSQAKPWILVQDGITAAAPGATVALAGGDYVEDVVVTGKALQLVGRCPSLVTLSNAGQPPAALQVLSPQAAGTLVRDIAVTSTAARAIAVSGASDVVVERVWLHDVGGSALLVDDAFGPTSLTLADSLLERTKGSGVAVIGATVRIERSVIRETASLPGGFGRGAEASTRAQLSINGSLFERTHDIAIHAAGAQVDVDATAILDVLPDQTDLVSGRGVNAQRSMDGLDATVHVTSSLVAGASEVAVAADGATLDISGSVVRDTQPSAANGLGGMAMVAQANANDVVPSLLTVSDSLILRARDGGVVVSSSQLVMSRTAVRDIVAVSPQFGRGINVQSAGLAATAAVSDSVVEGTEEIGVAFLGATGSLTNVAIRDSRVRQSDAELGDGLLVLSTAEQTASVEALDLLVQGSQRAGLSSFGATASLSSCTLECNVIDLNGEDNHGLPALISDGGGNRCGCADATRACQVVSSALAPPALLP